MSDYQKIQKTLKQDKIHNNNLPERVDVKKVC